MQSTLSEESADRLSQVTYLGIVELCIKSSYAYYLE